MNLSQRFPNLISNGGPGSGPRKGSAKKKSKETPEQASEWADKQSKAAHKNGNVGHDFAARQHTRAAEKHREAGNVARALYHDTRAADETKQHNNAQTASKAVADAIGGAWGRGPRTDNKL